MATDHLVCGTCKGGKVVIVESTGKTDLCPRCSGRGHLPTEKELAEDKGQKRKRVLHG